MKRTIVITLAMTGLSLVVLALLALLSGAQWLSLVSIFQVLILNVLIQAVIQITERLDTRTLVFKLVLDFLLIGGLLGLTSLIFKWDNWPVTLMTGALVYLVSLGLDLISLNKEAAEINRLIKKRVEDN